MQYEGDVLLYYSKIDFGDKVILKIGGHASNNSVCFVAYWIKLLILLMLEVPVSKKRKQNKRKNKDKREK